MTTRGTRDTALVLFESGPDEERLHVEAAPMEDGGLLVRQESEGELTRWCFGESPHVVDTCIGASSLRRLGEHFHVEGVGQVVEVLAMRFTGYDAGDRLRGLLRHLGIPYEVYERAPQR